MDAVLDDPIAAWLDGADAVRTIDDASVAVVRAEVRRRGAAIGLALETCERLAAAASEVAHNQLRHAVDGVVALREIARGAVPGLEVIAADRGRGITDPTAALTGAGGLGPASGLGVGLGAAYRLADEVDADVRLGAGTCLWLRGFAEPVPRSEIAIVGRACAGEQVSGDEALFVRRPDSMVVAVIDGVGHGAPAREAALLAAREVRAHAVRSPDELLGVIDGALVGTRGVVAAIARVEHDPATIVHAAAGNVTSRLVGKDGAMHLFGGVSRTLGARQPPRRITVERVATRAHATLVMYSDGLTSAVDLAGARDLLREPPLVIAHQLLVRYGRANDDATVAVVR